jgi:hypothetical protein
MKDVGRIALLSSILALAAPAWAQPREAASQARDPATADALFRQGRASMEAKNYVDACQKFAESQKLDPAAGTAMNLATCEERLGKLASAWQHWKEAIDALPPKDDRIPFARSRVEELEKRLPRLQITLASGGDKGAKVFRDEIELGPGGQGVPLPVDPGPHTVTVRMPGHFPKSVTVSLAVGEQSQIDVHPGAVDPSAAAAAVGPPPSSGTRTLGWVIGGIGVAGVGTAIASGLLLVNTKKTVDSHCQADKVCDQQGLDAAESGKKWIVVNTAGWIVGGLGLGLGAYFVLSSPKSSTSTALTTRLGPDGASLSYVGTF